MSILFHSFLKFMKYDIISYNVLTISLSYITFIPNILLISADTSAIFHKQYKRRTSQVVVSQQHAVAKSSWISFEYFKICYFESWVVTLKLNKSFLKGVGLFRYSWCVFLCFLISDEWGLLGRFTQRTPTEVNLKLCLK